MALNPEDVYIKCVTEPGRYTVVFRDIRKTQLDYVDVIAVIMHSKGRQIHLFDADYREELLHFSEGTEVAEAYLKWLRRRAGSS